MPKDPRIKKVLVIGSGPIIIGQAAEFDYSGTQACRALKSEGVETVLVNSNPATIMTDPDIADHVYIEPLTAEVIERIIEKEKPDAILPNLGGQMSYFNANDGTCEGVDYLKWNCFTVQFHPEANGGPKDTEFLFDQFVSRMLAAKGVINNA